MSESRIKTHIKPIHSTHILVKAYMRPVRVVMYHDDSKSEYVVHNELLKGTAPVGDDSCGFEHDCLDQGGYYPYKTEHRPFAASTKEEALFYAELEFKERARRMFNVF